MYVWKMWQLVLLPVPPVKNPFAVLPLLEYQPGYSLLVRLPLVRVASKGN